jgi:hypothetical protein
METVVKCSKIKEWNGKPIYSIEMSNGAIGESFQEIPIGTPEDQLKFEKNANSAYADRVKWNKPNTGGNRGGQRSGNESFALSYAKDIAIAHIAKGNDLKSEAIIQVAEVFYNWMESKKKA